MDIGQGLKNPCRQVAQPNIFFIVELNICGLSEWNIQNAPIVAPRVLIWFMQFLNTCVTQL
jgi:hypothetical protein